MLVPNKIKIKRVEEYYTHFIGKAKDGRQFMALIGATLPTPRPADWQNYKKWYAILHTFQAGGKHLETKAVYTGRTADGEDEVIEKARMKRNEMLSGLGHISFEDIKVELFSIEIDGFTFGLVNGSEPEEGIVKINLLPNDLAFFEPWDGNYET